MPWFWLIEAVAALDPVSPPLGATDQELVDFYAGNVGRLPVTTTLFVAQWVLLLALLVSVVRVVAGGGRGVAATLATALATAACAVYVGAEGVRLWPLLAADLSAARVRADLDPALAASAVLSRDGLHAPAGVLLGAAVLVIAGLLAGSDVWGRWVLVGLAVVAGAVGLTSVVAGPDGFGPGVIMVLWAPVTGVLLAVGAWRRRAAT